MQIDFQEVKSFIMNRCPNAQEGIVDATRDFVLDYVKHPVGYAETDNVNDIDKILSDIDMSFAEFGFEEDGRVRRGMINYVIKTEKKRWEEGRNAWFYGRHIGRVAHLLAKDRA